MILPRAHPRERANQLLLQFYGASADAAGVQCRAALLAVSIKLPKELFEDQDVTREQILVANKEL